MATLPIFDISSRKVRTLQYEIHMVMTENTMGDELGNVERGLVISIWVLAIDFFAGLLFTAFGYPWAMRRAAEFAGIYATMAASLWVGYIVFDLRRGLKSSGDVQTKLTEWQDSQEK